MLGRELVRAVGGPSLFLRVVREARHGALPMASPVPQCTALVACSARHPGATNGTLRMRRGLATGHRAPAWPALRTCMPCASTAPAACAPPSLAAAPRRASQPWPELKQFALSFDLSTLDDVTHSHVPFGGSRLVPCVCARARVCAFVRRACVCVNVCARVCVMPPLHPPPPPPPPPHRSGPADPSG